MSYSILANNSHEQDEIDGQDDVTRGRQRRGRMQFLVNTNYIADSAETLIATYVEPDTVNLCAYTLEIVT